MRHLLLTSALVVATVAGIGGIGPATAADMPEYVPIETPEPLPLPAGGWYLRGDIGYKIYDDPNGFYDLPGYENMFGESLEDTGVVGIGVGYRFNEYFRVDTTLDYEFESSMRGTLPCPNACAGGGTEESADLSAWTGLVNAYVEAGNFSGFTPYVGAGIGWSYLMTSDAASDSPGNYRGDNTWNFAWALMAGVGYDFTEQLTLDLNYRYLNLGDAQTIAPAGTPGSGILEWNDIAAHEIRVGMRYTFY
jgi:opacity protein-like surface antigen